MQLPAILFIYITTICIKVALISTEVNAVCIIYVFYPYVIVNILTMVLILDGNSEIGAHVRSHLCYMIFFKTFA